MVNLWKYDSYHEKDSMSAFWTVDRTFCKSGHAAIAWAEVASTRTKMVAQEPKYCQYCTRLVKCISPTALQSYSFFRSCTDEISYDVRTLKSNKRAQSSPQPVKK